MQHCLTASLSCAYGKQVSTGQPLFLCRQGMQKPIHFATVVTDLTTCHNAWFHRGVSRCFVPTAGALCVCRSNHLILHDNAGSGGKDSIAAC